MPKVVKSHVKINWETNQNLQAKVQGDLAPRNTVRCWGRFLDEQYNLSSANTPEQPRVHPAITTDFQSSH
jgi:hypothetical protein